MDAAAARVARPAPRAVVLQARADPVGPPHVGRHVIRERGAHHAGSIPTSRRRRTTRPCRRRCRTSRACFVAWRAAQRVDPDRVVVDVAHALDRAERLAAVDRLLRIDAADVDVSGLFGSTRIWLKYIGRWFSFDMNVQVLPLSVERQTPLPCGSGGCRHVRRRHRRRRHRRAATGLAAAPAPAAAPPRRLSGASGGGVAAAGWSSAAPVSLSGATSICA